MPDRVFAAFGSSAPVNFQYDMPNYLGHVGEVIRDPHVGGSQACYDNVRNAFAIVDGYLNSNKLGVLRADFNICSSSNATDDKEKFAIARHLSGLIADVNQYSFSNPAINTYAGICRPFTRPGVEPYEVLKKMLAESSPETCATISYQALLDDLNKWSNGITDWEEYDKDSGGRPWGFEICNNMGFNVYCNTAKGCPMSNFASQLGQSAMCQDAFGISDQQMRANSAKFLKTYGGANPLTTRLLLTHGAVDCGYPYEMNTTVENKEIYSFTTAYVGHVVDLNPATGYEPVALYETRKAVAQVLQKWVQDAKTAGSSQTYLSSVTIVFLVFFYSLY
uniref:Uncharacterized protein n=1 Tax=Plectus sambesii TaxID=2011161 RepID=A0A914W656_9BILA